jgi:SAM-dependent methyltransferase
MTRPQSSSHQVHEGLLEKVSRYYSTKLAEHGPLPQGVDWNGEQSQRLRFEQLLRVCDVDRPFSLNDYGCGYGAMVTFLEQKGWDVDYGGCDVSADMIRSAEAIHPPGSKVRFEVASAPTQSADYTVASGILNVKLDASVEQWWTFVAEALDVMAARSLRGFAFNCLTSYSDPERLRETLFYADPCRVFDLCKRRYSRNVALLHDYGLYEFTMLVRLA